MDMGQGKPCLSIRHDSVGHLHNNVTTVDERRRWCAEFMSHCVGEWTMHAGHNCTLLCYNHIIYTREVLQSMSSSFPSTLMTTTNPSHR